VQSYFDANFDNYEASIEVDDKSGRAVIRLPYTDNKKTIDDIRYFEKDLGLTVELKQTTLEEVFLMEGDVQRYSEIGNIGKGDLTETWTKLLDHSGEGNFFVCYWQILKKSKLHVI
jgi:hypothetical protein